MTELPVRSSTLDLIGNTPLVLLQGPSEAAGCEIWGKCEFANPGASVKDRAALWIVRDAEARGELRPGGTVVEGTAGNTGIGIALVCNALGYKCVIVMPDNQSKEKMDTLRALGAELVTVPPTKFADPNHFVHTSRRIAEETENAVWANQFDNTANRDAHYASTGPEIWHETGGRIDAFVCATGTGGTLGGVSRYLKQQKPGLRVVLADPMGSALYNWVKTGILKSEGSSAVTEGIGIGRVTANLKDAPIDDAVHVTDAEAVGMVYRLLREEGLFLGSAAGVNVAGALAVARELGPGHRVVTILCDGGHKYQSRLYNREWLAGKGLLEAAGLA